MSSANNKKAKALSDFGKVSRFQTFVVERVHRSKIKTAAYNPRAIDDEAAGKLHDNLQRVGLVSTLTWNKRTGNLVSGHQRLAQLDALEGSLDYWLDVSAIDVDEATEIEQNIFLNYRGAQGDYDAQRLAGLLTGTDVEVDLSKIGFDALDLQLMLDDAGAGMFNDAEGLAAIDELKAMGAEKSVKRHADREPGEMPSRAVSGEIAIKERAQQEETETFVNVLFLTRKERAVFLAAMGCDESERYIVGAKVFARLGIDPSQPWAAEL